jgi:Aspartyl/Asparaginyl beta-hydroxylase
MASQPVPEPEFPDRVRLPLAFDPARLAADLAALDGTEWVEHYVRQNYDGDWSVVPLRAPVGATHPIQMIYSPPGITDFVDTVFLTRTPCFAEVIAAFHCPVMSVRLMRLTPGSVIKEHRDHDLRAEEGVARIHVPVVTNPDVDFQLNRTAVTMLPGEAWYLRLADPHSVANRGAATRVHLVLDVVVNDWLAGLLGQ